jgi:hypothetical protein
MERKPPIEKRRFHESILFSPPGPITRDFRAIVLLWIFAVAIAGHCGPLSVSAAPLEVDPGRVIELTEVQCALGPRVPGTEAHGQGRDWIVAELEALGLEVEVQAFEADLALTGERATAWNVWARPPQMADEEVILLSAHWDTRPFADEEPEGQPNTPFPGANDGAASVAFVLEVLRVTRGTELENRIAAAFFDAEDSGVRGDRESWCLGAQYGARNPPGWMDRVALGINIDMIAHSGVTLRREAMSQKSAPGAMDRLWRIGGDLAPHVFIDRVRLPVIDDHLPFIQQGYRYIVLIGLPNPHWHRLSDRPENLDPASIGPVGAVLLEFLARELRGGSPNSSQVTRGGQEL